jgi:hypothetical protein
MNIHVWRFAHNCLPSGVQLCRRQIPNVDGSCIFCGSTEGIEHVLIFCQFARIVWRQVKEHIPLTLKRKNFSSMKQWLLDFIGRSNDPQATTLVVTFWHIWEARNETRNSDVKPNPSRTVGKILAYVDLIQQHLFKPATSQRCVSTPVASLWTPPPPGMVLVMSDAATFQAAGGISAGVLGRDHSGFFLAACRQFYEGLQTPEYAEAMALRRAVELAQAEGWNSVIFASDCLSLVQRLNAAVMDRSAVGLVVSTIKVLVSGFTSVSFRHVKRDLNKAVHILAKSCIDLNSSCVFHSVPDCIRGTLCIDVF